MQEESYLLSPIWLKTGMNREFLVYFTLFNQPNIWPSRRVHRVDYRTRRDRTEWCTAAFEKQMGDITDAYLEWSYATSVEGGAMPTGPVPVDSGEYSIRVVDTFGW